MTKHAVCFADELQPGDKKIVEIAGRSIGVFRVRDDFYAVRNRCPHKGAPLCLGLVKGLVVGSRPYEYELTREGEILKCPWHGWEFDIMTGRSVFNPHKLRVKSYAVSVEDPAQAEPGETYDFVDEVPGPGEDPSIETYSVTIEPVTPANRAMVYVHVET